MNRRFPGELPPTAGLPLRWRDFLPGPAPLERTLAGLFDTPPMQLECSGTSALRIALQALQQRQPQRRGVIVPAYTCPLVAIAVHSLGLEPRLCDLAPGHFDFDPDALAALCDADTLAVVPTHLGGRVADVERACAIAARHGAFVVEDAAQALGALDHGRSVGLRGDVGLFSLAAGKGLSLFEGGLLLTRDSELREALAHASRTQAGSDWRWELRRSVELLGLAACYRPSLLPLVYGRPLRRALAAGDPEEAVGDVFPLRIPQHRVGRWRRGIGHRAAARLPAFLAQGRVRARHWKERLRALPGLQVHDDRPDTQGVWPVLMLQLPDAARRDAALARLWTRGLGVSRMFIHALPDYAYLRGIVPAMDMPNARDFAARTLTIGNSPWLDEARFEAIVEELRAVLAA
ncbi:DegT/DnrJ/EryC1/StrS family aminotransferase [Stenotrophomonas mori]|uniref:DegT/DnrJ/EryC1/StrS family aminotransferase n=1 Tax=Stenotrophomonas mori TaxID=2871096 RepID=A0ABT0SFA5_9GAMM|nr:DegT/DnrJ/EryC1/StrS family aminotransferase [Stenotrophomonas mori]MCL7714000.1 DegT/DnrJ/EryC1/StrS family aminotransferase [Stenotrophomonas mori]